MLSLLRSFLFTGVFSVFGARVITWVERSLGGRKALPARMNMSHRALMAKAFQPMQPKPPPTKPPPKTGRKVHG